MRIATTQRGAQHVAGFRTTGNKRQEDVALVVPVIGTALLPTMRIHEQYVYIHDQRIVALATSGMQEALHGKGGDEMAQSGQVLLCAQPT